MNLFVQGVQFRNKGAHLMLEAIREETSSWPADVVLAMDPRRGSRRQRRRAGVLDHAWYESQRVRAIGPAGGVIGNLLPRKLLRRLGFIADNALTGVLDASGFSYSDQWGASGVDRMVHRCTRWKRRSLPIVLLPQAFGPFGTERIRRSFRKLTSLVDLIYVRDERSERHVLDLGIPAEKLRQSPDFTCLVAGIVREEQAHLFGRPCLIPNYRMVDKTEGEVANSYVDFLVACARRAFDVGTEPFVLIHDQGRDSELVSSIEHRLGRHLEIVIEDDPVVVKGLVGQATFVVGSRFHGLVSAFSQGVPCVGTSWSHKYEALFRSFGCESLLVPREGLGKPEVQNRIMDVVLDPVASGQVSTKARETAAAHVSRTHEMWKEVRELLGVPPPSLPLGSPPTGTDGRSPAEAVTSIGQPSEN